MFIADRIVKYGKSAWDKNKLHSEGQTWHSKLMKRAYGGEYWKSSGRKRESWTMPMHFYWFFHPTRSNSNQISCCIEREAHANDHENSPIKPQTGTMTHRGSLNGMKNSLEKKRRFERSEERNGRKVEISDESSISCSDVKVGISLISSFLTALLGIQWSF